MAELVFTLTAILTLADILLYAIIAKKWWREE